MMAQHKLIYREHEFQPEDLLNFVELKWFSRKWDNSLGLGDEDLTALQVLIMCGPKAAPVERGTDGLRKLRFSPRNWPHGKSSGVRVCYVYFEKYGTVLLVTVYAKNEKDALSASDKTAIRKLIKRAEDGFKRQYGF